jgi:hypothetical protein
VRRCTSPQRLDLVSVVSTHLCKPSSRFEASPVHLPDTSFVGHLPFRMDVGASPVDSAWCDVCHLISLPQIECDLRIVRQAPAISHGRWGVPCWFYLVQRLSSDRNSADVVSKYSCGNAAEVCESGKPSFNSFEHFCYNTMVFCQDYPFP